MDFEASIDGDIADRLEEPCFADAGRPFQEQNSPLAEGCFCKRLAGRLKLTLSLEKQVGVSGSQAQGRALLDSFVVPTPNVTTPLTMPPSSVLLMLTLKAHPNKEDGTMTATDTLISEVDQGQTSLDRLVGDYTIDPAHTRIGFQARHAMVTKVRGHFKEFEGSFHFDPSHPDESWAMVTIQAKSIDTGNEQRDAHLRSNDFFAMDQFPEITFESTSVQPIDHTHCRLNGALTIRGVTRPVSLDFEFYGAVTDPWGNTRIGFEGSTEVNRKDWGVNYNVALDSGGVLVSDKVKLEFDVSATKNA